MKEYRCSARDTCGWTGPLPAQGVGPDRGQAMFYLSCPSCGRSVEQMTDRAIVSNNTVMTDAAKRAIDAKDDGKEKSDGLTAHYYELPEAATELYHLITYKNMNAQIGEIFRACYRYGEVEHSAKLRDVNKMLAYATQEKERLLKYELSNNEE